MSEKCVCCSSSEMPLYARVAISPDGTQYQVPFCRNCYEAVKNMDRVHTAQSGVLNLLDEDAPIPQPEFQDDDNVIYVKKMSTGWETFLKVICIILVIIATVVGFIIGLASHDAVVSIIGGVAGFLGSMVAIAFTMVICEISTTLKEILVELRNQK